MCDFGSLACVQKHKEERECSGVRSKTSYISLQAFTDQHLLSGMCEAWYVLACLLTGRSYSKIITSLKKWEELLTAASASVPASANTPTRRKRFLLCAVFRYVLYVVLCSSIGCNFMRKREGPNCTFCLLECSVTPSTHPKHSETSHGKAVILPLCFVVIDRNRKKEWVIHWRVHLHFPECSTSYEEERYFWHDCANIIILN